ncbi:MAG TPA: hypothetical protein VEG62_05225 [Acidimicrobiales bacterium]|nr:hypothetical protein [Acidimicrobiales bacterium]
MRPKQITTETDTKGSVVLGLCKRLRPAVVLGTVALCTAATAVFGTSAAWAAQSHLRVGITVNGQSALASSDARPAQLYSSPPTQVHLSVTNLGSVPLSVTTVRFEGSVLGLPLYSYDSTVDLSVSPGATDSITFPVSMDGIGSEATGLVVAGVTLLSPGGATVASQSIVTNVHGQLTSIYGLFGLAVLVLTVSSLVLALVALARHTLPQNRWQRAIRFMIPGFGAGLVLTFTMAALGLYAPGPGHWLSLLVITTCLGIAVGYLTPAPNEPEFDDYDDDVLLAQIVVVDDDPLQTAGAARATTDLGAPVVGRTDGAGDGRATIVP